MKDVPLRVMVVDDNAANRQVLTMQLTHHGLRVEAVGGAEMALVLMRAQAATGHPYSLVFLDWQMPGKSGLELAREIRSDESLGDTHIVVLSSSSPTENTEQITDLRIDSFLSKPVSEAQILRSIECALSCDYSTDAKDGSGRSVKSTEAVNDRVLSVLVAEDDPTNQKIAQLLLVKMGHAVEFANNGEMAVEIVRRGGFDVVLMDCQMPLMDGYEARRMIRVCGESQVISQIPIIAVTTYAMQSNRLKCLDAGMNDYVSKPIRTEELRQALQRCGLVDVKIDYLSDVKGTDSREREVVNAAQIDILRLLPGINGQSLFPEVVEMFSKEEPVRLEEFSTLLNGRRSADLADGAHKLAGSCATLGATEMGITALALERAAKSEDWNETSKQIDALREGWRRFRSELRKYVFTQDESARG